MSIVLGSSNFQLAMHKLNSSPAAQLKGAGNYLGNFHSWLEV